MRILLVSLLLATFCGQAAAQALSVSIRQYMEALDAGEQPRIAGESLNEPELLSALYQRRRHAPLWSDGGELAHASSDVLEAIGQSVAHGFSAERYHRSAIERVRNTTDGSARLAYELLLTDAFVSQALHRGQGAVSPPNLDAEWQVPPAEVDALALLERAARGEGEVLALLDRLWPSATEYRLLLARRADIAASGDTTSVRIADGPLLKPGQESDRVLMLKERLLGPGTHDRIYDDRLLREVRAFQASAGLEPDGIVGANTLEVLNATRVSWIDRIDANLERWRWLPREEPDTYIRVNIAAFTLRAFEAGKATLAMNVIVGAPYRRTPVFTETLKYLVLNPYWNVPYSIATKDKLPLLRQDAAMQASKGFEARIDGSDTFVAVDAVDWTAVEARRFNYQLRQRPGPENALGRIKFMLPNPYAVYLHDTPTRELFRRSERSFSSGCVRLAEPLQLARWLLERENREESTQLEQLIDSGETRTLYLQRPIPTYLVYFTAFANDDGEVTFRRDIYGRDAVLIEALRNRSS